jgi:hypothetical protein
LGDCVERAAPAMSVAAAIECRESKKLELADCAHARLEPREAFGDLGDDPGLR